MSSPNRKDSQRSCTLCFDTQGGHPDLAHENLCIILSWKTPGVISENSNGMMALEEVFSHYRHVVERVTLWVDLQVVVAPKAVLKWGLKWGAPESR